MTSSMSKCKNKEHLQTILLCTLREEASISKIRGMDHILQQIWSLINEEWLDVNIVRFRCSSKLGIPVLTMPLEEATLLSEYGEENEKEASLEENDTEIQSDSSDEEEYRNGEYPYDRQKCGGCPVALIAKDVRFPPLSTVPMGTFAHQESEALYVNMMPISLASSESLPPCCLPYWPMIEQCVERTQQHRYRRDTGEEVGYLTIDERPVEPGNSQRRGGLHVESPGVLPVPPDSAAAEGATIFIAGPHGRYVPGVEHHWGQGLMMRNERVLGGIFMASNVSGTTAVWNASVNNPDGSIIGAHGNIERLRPLLGPPARILRAGELIWMTDRTPHESLPVPCKSNETPPRRQYFRLVIGTVSAWFADHSTPNPLGHLPPDSVRIVHGDKFSLHRELNTLYPLKGRYGNAEKVSKAREVQALRSLLYDCGLGHLYQRFLDFGITSPADIVKEANKSSSRSRHDRDWLLRDGKDGKKLLNEQAAYYYEHRQIDKLVRRAEALGSTKGTVVSSVKG